MTSDVQKFDREYFEKYYESEAYIRGTGRKYRTYLSLLRRFLSNGSVLEIGCGYGGFLTVSSTSYQVTGIDVSGHALTRIRNSSHTPGCNLVCASGEALPFSKKFDAIVAFDCLEHLAKPDKCLKEINRLQNVGGILMIVVPVYDTFVGKIVGLLDDDTTHLHKRSRYFWIECMKTAGYTAVILRGAWRYLLLRRLYINFTSPIWKASPALLIVARKDSETC